ncbi:uncharacterized protein LOC123295299 [Chrysoperla carnea]|uniref:uncharacterized protein LOC123295299 n=1 Tax=Chrysoperla carnea TaxID=189513 RepID=UPI001D07C9F7|nr:uncharacterized protein LOC123295299 [Chrysoperla carnea]
MQNNQYLLLLEKKNLGLQPRGMSDTQNNNTIFEFTAVYQTNDLTKEHYKNGTTQQNNEQKQPINPYIIYKHIEAATEQINNATFNYTKEINEIISKLVHKTFEHITLQHDEITKLQSRLQLQLAKTKQLQESAKQDYYRYDVILDNITEQLYNRKLLKRVLKNWHDDIRTGPINIARAYNINNKQVSDDSMGEHDEVESIKTLENEILKLKSEKSVLLNSVKNAVTQGLSFITNETMKALDPNETSVKSPLSQHSSKVDEFTFNSNQNNSIRYPQDNCQMCSCNLDYLCQKNSNNTMPMQHCNCKSKFTSICCDNVRQIHDFELKHGDKNDCLYQQPMFDNRLLSDGPQFSYDMNGYTFCNRFGGGGNNKNIIPVFGKRPYMRMPHNKRKKKNMQQRGNAKLHKQESTDFNQQTDILKSSIMNNKRIDEFKDRKILGKTDSVTTEKINNDNKTENDTKATDTAISAREKLEKALFRSVENYECNSECCCNLQNESKNEEPAKIESNNSDNILTKSTDDLNSKPMDYRDDNSSEHNSESKTQINYIELANNTTSPSLRQRAQSPRQTVANKQQDSPKFNQFKTKIDIASLKKQFQQEQFPKAKTNPNNVKRMSMSDCALLEKCTYFRNISENSSPTFQEEQMEYINDYNRTVRKNFLSDDLNNSDGGNRPSSNRIFNRTDNNQKKKCACLSVCTCPIWCTLNNIEEKVLKKTSTNTSLENSPRSDNQCNSDCKCLFRGIH